MFLYKDMFTWTLADSGCIEPDFNYSTFSFISLFPFTVGIMHI